MLSQTILALQFELFFVTWRVSNGGNIIKHIAMHHHNLALHPTLGALSTNCLFAVVLLVTERNAVMATLHISTREM